MKARPFESIRKGNHVGSKLSYAVGFCLHGSRACAIAPLIEGYCSETDPPRVASS
jgi:hypothetical protein